MKFGRGRTFSPWNSPRAVALALGGTCVVVLLVLASIVSNGSNSRAMAANARSLHWVNSLLGSAALARAANAQALVFAVDHDLGVASATALETAVSEAREAIRYLDDTVALRPTDSVEMDPGLEFAIETFLLINRQVLADIALGNTAEAVQLSQGGLEVSFQSLEVLLDGVLTRTLDTVNDTETALGRMASIANLVVTLLIPGTAITIYFFFARRQIRERRLSMEFQLEAAHELSRAKDEFIGSLSHELRTPLTSIYGFSEFLLGAGVLDPKQAKELITIINTESGELMRMVEDLLTGARLDSGALTFDLTDVAVLREVEMVVEPFRRAGIGITVSCGPMTVVADQMRFRQVLRNLVSNAHKHGGLRIAIGTQVKDDDLVLAVIDDGPGVPTEIEGRLFERFVHDGRRAVLTGSVGLGLAIARTLTEAMGGTLRYERVQGYTVFSLTLPLATPADESILQIAKGEDK